MNVPDCYQMMNFYELFAIIEMKLSYERNEIENGR